MGHGADVKVGELIAGSTFTPGQAWTQGVAPRVSVLLPTFRRGDSGMLSAAIDSILRQSWTDLELIIVDDASTDSTREVLRHAMARDARVSVIRHAHNVGLPAVSEYEAFAKARGELFAFAFDDTVFAPDAIGALVAASSDLPPGLVAGHMEVLVRSPWAGEPVPTRLGEGARPDDLLVTNVIPNAAVMLPRHVLETVGLYDPHVGVARVCDYDLWLRVRRRYPVHIVDVHTGQEHGAATSDSLGATYPLDSWLAADRMRDDRDAALLPGTMEDLDVFDIEGFRSARSRALALTLASEHAAARPWMRAPVPAPHEGEREPRVVVIARLERCAALDADLAKGRGNVHARLFDPAKSRISELAAADAVVVEDVARARTWLAAATRLGIPWSQVHDDGVADAEEWTVDSLVAAPRRRVSVGTAPLHEVVAAAAADVESAAEPDEVARLADLANGLAADLARIEGGEWPSAGAMRAKATGETVSALLSDVRRFARTAGRRRSSSLARLAEADSLLARGVGSREWWEVGTPLGAVPYLHHRVDLPEGRYVRVGARVRGMGRSGEYVGVEIVSPDGAIVEHRRAPLPDAPGAHDVTWDIDLRVAEHGTFEVRLFVKAEQPVLVVERFVRGSLRGAVVQLGPVVWFAEAHGGAHGS